jgi:hypothetical protein
LSGSDSALSQFIKITEEFLNTNSLHYNECLKTLLYVRRVVCNVDGWLQIAVLKHIDVLSGTSEEVASSKIGCIWSFRFKRLSLSLKLWEHVLWSVYIGTEREIVDLTGISLIKILSDNEIENLLI